MALTQKGKDNLLLWLEKVENINDMKLLIRSLILSQDVTEDKN